MKVIIKMFIIIICLMNINLSAQNEDYEGCKDHPMFNRMPNFHIITCV